MVEEDFYSVNISSATSLNMDYDYQQDKKDISKSFALLRSKLNAKEKELLELQRAQPSLLAPDSEQIDELINLISSLQLSTQEGSFLFPSTIASNESTSTATCSTGVDTIKTLPSNIWLPEVSSPIEQEQTKTTYRLPMVSHLLSLPVSAYVASTSNRSTIPSIEAKPYEPSNRLPMVSQLLSMPISAFKSTSNIQQINDSSSIQVEDKKEKVVIDKKLTSSIEPVKSIFETEPTYSKEHWLRKSPSLESVSLDLDEYIEQASDKMRRLHFEYLEALEKLNIPSKSEDSTQAIKSIYPQTFNRIKQNTTTTKSSRIFPLE
ncbi:hypothetical protein I4U23_006148 [Adineta vaga]|nr:hypothetical protein I4U23_006148 [Adineta vaga]